MANAGDVTVKMKINMDNVKAIEIEALAKIAYTAYGKTTDFKNFMGNPMPLWEELPEKIREAWGNAADSVVVEITQSVEGE